MFWIIGCGLTGVVVAVVETAKYFASPFLRPDFWAAAFLYVILAAVGALIGGAVGSGISWICSFFVKYEKKVSTISLVSLERGLSIHGSFFLGCGSVDSVPHYFFYENLGDDVFQLHSIPAKRATIHEVDGKIDGELAITREAPIGNKGFINAFTNGAESKNFSFRFTIPKGSIKHDFAP